MSEPVMHTSLVPELLHNTLSFMSKDENKINACVCKQWSKIALDFIWREVDSLPQLLNLLRLYHDGEDNTRSIEHLDPKNWERFQMYADRVRTLRYRKGQSNFNTLFNDMARTRLRFEMFPNLQTLEWHSRDDICMTRAMVFMHQHVRHFIFDIHPSVKYYKIPSFFADACARMLHLHLLELRASFRVCWIERDIINFLQGLPDLETVIFPEFYLTSAIVSELSRMKHIRCIRIESGDKQGRGAREDVHSFAPVLERGAFPVLQTLYITACLGDATKFMGAVFAPTNLTSLFINNYIESEPDELRTLLLILSDKCHLLSALRILLLQAHVDEKPMKLTPKNQITFHTLKPVLSFQNLTLFEISHKYPINIILEEIEELASRWPSLESLSLNEAPLFMPDATLDMRALLPFAHHCPRLRHLGIFMNTNTVKIHQIQNSWKPFAALRSLSVGSSQLDVSNLGSVGAFLSHICPPECILKAESHWSTSPSRAFLSHALLKDIDDRIARWSQIVLILPSLIRLCKSILHEVNENSKTINGC